MLLGTYGEKQNMKLFNVKAVVCAASVVALSLTGCTSVESAQVAGNEITANGGEAIAVIQANSIGITAIFHIIDLVTSDMDQVVNKLLVAEAKAMGGSKIDLKGASTTPRHGIFALAGGIIGFPFSNAMGVAVK
jgi:hypothetical protein